MASRKDQGTRRQDHGDDRQLLGELHVEQTENEHSAHLKVVTAESIQQQD